MEVLIISKKLNKLALMMAGVLAATSVAATASINGAGSVDLIDSTYDEFLGTTYLNARTYRMDASTEAEYAAESSRDVTYIAVFKTSTGDLVHRESNTGEGIIEAYISVRPSEVEWAKEDGEFTGEFIAEGIITRGIYYANDTVRAYATS